VPKNFGANFFFCPKSKSKRTKKICLKKFSLKKNIATTFFYAQHFFVHEKKLGKHTFWEKKISIRV